MSERSETPAAAAAARTLEPTMTEQDPRPQRQWLTTEQLAAYIETPMNTLLSWRRKGQGPCHHKLGRRVRYKRTDVDAWLASCVIGAAPAPGTAA